ncbi:MAG: glycosyltransferase family 39 protein [Desulfarculaceae bacterium]|nr:glycosyltransferase family 39 protein [Desulfarculaceae bacterium]
MRGELSAGQVAIRLLLVLLAGALVRGAYLAWPYLDSDIAVVGLMARHALEGEFTPLFWGNHYGGSLEAILAAGSFALAGATPRVLNATAALISLAYLPLLYLLGKELINQRAGLAAALLSALGPYMLVAYSVVARGLHVEMLPLGALLLWLTVRLLKAGPLASGQAGALIAWGLTAGVGVWTNPLFVYFLPPTLLLLLYRAPRLLISWRFWGMALAGLVGASPLLYHNWLTQGGTLHYMEMPRPHSGFWANLHFLVREGLPATVGASWFRKDWVLPGLGPALAAAAGLAALWALARWGVDLWRRLMRWEGAGGGEVLLLTFLCIAYVFCAVGGADSGSFRYLLALYLIWPLAVALLWDRLTRAGGPLALAGWLLLALVAGMNLYTAVAFSPLNHPEQRAAAEGMAAEQASLTEAMVERGLRYAYVVDYWTGMKNTFLAKEKVILLPFDHERYPPYKRRLLRAPRYGLAVMGEHNAAVTREALATVGAACREEQAPPRWRLFYDFRPPAPRVSGLSPQGWSVAPGGGEALWDRDAATRLVLAQEPGASITLDLGRAQEGVCSLMLFPGEPRLLPRELTLSGSADGESWQELAKARPYLPFFWTGGKLAISGRAPWQEIRFAPRELRYLRLAQSGEASGDWALNELLVGVSQGEGRQATPRAAASALAEMLPGRQPVWAEPGLAAWLPARLRVDRSPRHRPAWLPRYLNQDQLLPQGHELHLAVRASLAPAARAALHRAGYAISEKPLPGWVLFIVQPRDASRPLYWAGLLPLVVGESN